MGHYSDGVESLRAARSQPAYKCTSCGYELQVTSTQHLPPCPECSIGEYEAVRAATV